MEGRSSSSPVKPIRTYGSPMTARTTAALLAQTPKLDDSFLRRADGSAASAVRLAGSDPTAGAGCTYQHRPAEDRPPPIPLRVAWVGKKLKALYASSQSASGSYAVCGCCCAPRCATRQPTCTGKPTGRVNTYVDDLLYLAEESLVKAIHEWVESKWPCSALEWAREPQGGATERT